MSSGLAGYVDEALEREIAEKRSMLTCLEEQCAQRELELTTLRLELETFRVRYWKLVAPLYAKLDEIESEIKAYEASENPASESARAEAEKAKQRAEESQREAYRSFEEPSPKKFEVSEDLKRVYRRAAKLIHPDRARDDADRERRTNIMANVNNAYKQGDIAEIERLIEMYKAGLQPEKNLNPREFVKQIEKQIDQVKLRLIDIEHEFNDIMGTDLAKLMRDVERGEARGRSPLKELVVELEMRITDALERLKAIREKFRSSHGELETNVDEELPVTDEPPPASSASDNTFRPEGCIHRTDRGEWVRSKSEVIIANLLHQLGLDYRYEYPLEGDVAPGIRRPDFIFFDQDGKPLVWEHLGLLNDEKYRSKWEKKQAWYEQNNFIQGVNLFITRDEADGSLDSQKLRKVASYIRTLV